jgi:hypothetical protein
MCPSSQQPDNRRQSDGAISSSMWCQSSNGPGAFGAVSAADDGVGGRYRGVSRQHVELMTPETVSGRHVRYSLDHHTDHPVVESRQPTVDHSRFGGSCAARHSTFRSSRRATSIRQGVLTHFIRMESRPLALEVGHEHVDEDCKAAMEQEALSIQLLALRYAIITARRSVRRERLDLGRHSMDIALETPAS